MVGGLFQVAGTGDDHFVESGLPVVTRLRRNLIGCAVGGVALHDVVVDQPMHPGRIAVLQRELELRLVERAAAQRKVVRMVRPTQQHGRPTALVHT